MEKHKAAAFAALAHRRDDGPLFGCTRTHDRAGIVVRPIHASEAHDLLLNVHYAGRIPSISLAFGLFVDGAFEGCITYGSPAAAPVRTGLLGREMAGQVLELNRLCLRHNARNHASQLIAASLRLIAPPRAILSFADPSHGHVGTVYQAANFLYCGLSAKRTDWKITGHDHLHPQTVADMTRRYKDAPDLFLSATGRAAAAREIFGDAFTLAQRPRKHRYVYFLGSKRQRREMRAALRYPVLPYPKAAA